MKNWFASLGVLAFCWWHLDAAYAQGPENVLLLVNENSPDSQSIARYYAAKRKLPAENICRIRTSESETISQAAFEREILQPAAAYLKSKNLQDRILYIVTTRGIPLVVEGRAGPVGDLASVDSRLTLLYGYMVFGNRLSQGRVENPYFAVEIRREDFRLFSRQDYDIYLVTRLTGPSVIESVKLVDRALEAAATGAFYFDLASARQSTVSDWLQEAAGSLKSAGLGVTIDSTAKVLDNLANVQGYVNQGTRDAALPGSVPGIRWSPGGLADILDSGTCQAGQDHGSGKGSSNSSSIASKFVESGVTGFACYVSDPTVDGYVRPQILFPAYAAGYNLAEASYAAARYLGWRQVIIGDPLASPYGSRSARQRESQAGKLRSSIDKETGFPEHFALRRQLYLVHKYNTNKEAVSLLLKAERAAARGENADAVSFVDKSLGQDPYISESVLLKAELLERAGDFKSSFEHYEKALKLGAGSRDVYEKLARTAFEKLEDPGKAEPYAARLFRLFGRSEPELAFFYAEVMLKAGKTEEAAALLNRLVTGQTLPPARALTALGRIALEKGNPDQARDFFKRALERADSAADAADSVTGSAGRVDRTEIRKLLDQASARTPPPAASAAPEAPAQAPVSSTTDCYPAQVVNRTPIPYPDRARSAGIQGTVVVELLIDEMGQLMKGELVSGDRTLAGEVLKAVKGWKFEPRMENGRAIVSRLTLPVVFKLNKPTAEQ